MVLHSVERVERVRTRCHAFAQSPCHSVESVLLAPLEQRQLPAAVEQADVLVTTGYGVHEPLHEGPSGGALDDGLDDLVGEEAGHPDRVELAELGLVVREQRLGDQLEQDGVVALEGREHVGVSLELG